MRRLFTIIAWPILCAGAFAADYAQAGALAKAGNWEIGIRFDESVSSTSVAVAQNYILPPEARLEYIREQSSVNAVVLGVSGLATNATYTVTLTNIVGSSGAALPALTLSFKTKPISWAAIGTQELGFPADAFAVGENGFDLLSGGIEMWSGYDESTFVYEQVTGDFDRRVRVESQENSSTEARAGLMVREVLDEGKPRPIDLSNPEQAFSRYLQVHVNPVMTAYTDFEGNPAPARNEHQVNIRFFPGGSTDNPVVITNAPAYPNAWLRLKRVGPSFHVFRGEDGTNWVRLGTFTFPNVDLDGNTLPPFSTNAYVGPNYSPENANIPESSGQRRAFVARFREYSEATGDVTLDPPQLTIGRSGEQIEISWSTGTLQTSTNIASGAWTDLGTASPLKLAPDKRYQFFRARNP